jgi:predicted O-linked N-acetylglucosamine transferase (SPINDLY family)
VGRGRLQRQRPTAPLFDVASYTVGLEALYTEMWQRHRDGLPPQAMGA